MDPLSDVLSLLRPYAYVSSGFDAGGSWGVRFGDQHELIKCYAVVKGTGWLTVDGLGDPVCLEAGNCFVLPSGRPFRLGSEPQGPAIPASELFPPHGRGGRVTLNGGGDFFLVGSRFGVSGARASWLLNLLPPVVHIADQPATSLRSSVEQMMAELSAPRPGHELVMRHLAYLMLMQALRVHLETAEGDRSGWFFALTDPQIGVTLQAMHAEPARSWTLNELARAAGMSRSTFASRFRERAGEPPLRYLSRWRMLLACDRLERAAEPVSTIAFSLGYESESAFSNAFKRMVGCPPRSYARRSGARPVPCRPGVGG
jgi:AraC-like DNA-binding protein